jgi:TIGR03118 family protein
MLRSFSGSGAKISATTIITLTLLFATSAFAQKYQQTDLVVDNSSISSKATVDPNLVNAWGISRSTGSPFWISDNGMGVSTLYDSTGAIVPLVVTIPTAKGGTPPSAPPGTVFNFTTGFNVAAGAPAIFMFVTENGTIAAWNPTVNLTSAVTKVDHSASGAIFKGCAIAMTSAGPRLYVNNFATGKVEIYDSNFVRVSSSAFVDNQLPVDYAPFGIQNVGGNIVVTFAHRLPGSTDEDHGAGVGTSTS